MSNTVNWNEQTSQSYEKFRAQGSSLLTHIYPELIKLKIFQTKQTLLSIGPGGGWLEVALAKDYEAHLTFVEPSLQFVNEFKDKITEFKLEHTIDEVFSDKFENFHTNKKYDRILAIHSWHYIGFDETQFKKAISLLAPGGIFCIAQTSEDAFTKALKDLLYPNGHFFINIEELSRFCDSINLNHEMIIIPKILSIERYLQNDQLTEYTKSWLSMMGRISYDDIPEKSRESAKDILKKFTRNNTIDDAWGVILFRN